MVLTNMTLGQQADKINRLFQERKNWDEKDQAKRAKALDGENATLSSAPRRLSRDNRLIMVRNYPTVAHNNFYLTYCSSGWWA